MGLYQCGCVSVLAAESSLKHLDGIVAYQACPVCSERKTPTLELHYPRAYIHSMTLRSVTRAPENQGALNLHDAKRRVVHCKQPMQDDLRLRGSDARDWA